MLLTDTHAHLDHAQYDADREAVMQRAWDHGVRRVINVGFNRRTIEGTIKLAEKYTWVDIVVGWHPLDAETMTEADLAYVEHVARTHPQVVALGEMGLDYAHHDAPRDVQQQVFRMQIRLARQLSLPIVIHNREASADVLHIMKEEKAYDIGGVMHCFSGSWETAQRCLAMNFYISFGGPITFKNAKQPQEVLMRVPAERLLLETDAPYLAPHPYRGKRNEPMYVVQMAMQAARLRGVDVEALAAQTTHNATTLFKRK